MPGCGSCSGHAGGQGDAMDRSTAAPGKCQRPTPRCLSAPTSWCLVPGAWCPSLSGLEGNVLHVCVCGGGEAGGADGHPEHVGFLVTSQGVRPRAGRPGSDHDMLYNSASSHLARSRIMSSIIQHGAELIRSIMLSGSSEAPGASLPGPAETAGHQVGAAAQVVPLSLLTRSPIALRTRSHCQPTPHRPGTPAAGPLTTPNPQAPQEAPDALGVPEILVRVLHFLEPDDRVRRAALVCKDWRDALQDFTLWRALVDEQVQRAPPAPRSRQPSTLLPSTLPPAGDQRSPPPPPSPLHRLAGGQGRAPQRHRPAAEPAAAAMGAVPPQPPAQPLVPGGRQPGGALRARRGAPACLGGWLPRARERACMRAWRGVAPRARALASAPLGRTPLGWQGAAAPEHAALPGAHTPLRPAGAAGALLPPGRPPAPRHVAAGVERLGQPGAAPRLGAGSGHQTEALLGARRTADQPSKSTPNSPPFPFPPPPPPPPHQPKCTNTAGSATNPHAPPHPAQVVRVAGGDGVSWEGLPRTRPGPGDHPAHGLPADVPPPPMPYPGGGAGASAGAAPGHGGASRNPLLRLAATLREAAGGSAGPQQPAPPQPPAQGSLATSYDWADVVQVRARPPPRPRPLPLPLPLAPVTPPSAAAGAARRRPGPGRWKRRVQRPSRHCHRPHSPGQAATPPAPPPTARAARRWWTWRRSWRGGACRRRRRSSCWTAAWRWGSACGWARATTAGGPRARGGGVQGRVGG
jgi:hypothetical protein